MHDRLPSKSKDGNSPARPNPVRSAPSVTALPASAAALTLQRAVGNRAAIRVLSRWAAHPDKDKKGVLMTDAAAGQYNRLNPPLSK